MPGLAGGAGFSEDVGVGVVFEPGAAAHARNHVAVGAAAHAHGQDGAFGTLGVVATPGIVQVERPCTHIGRNRVLRHLHHRAEARLDVSAVLPATVHVAEFIDRIGVCLPDSLH